MTRDPRAAAMSEAELMEAIRAMVRDLGLLAFHAADSRRSWGRGYPGPDDRRSRRHPSAASARPRQAACHRNSGSGARHSSAPARTGPSGGRATSCPVASGASSPTSQQSRRRCSHEKLLCVANSPRLTLKPARQGKGAALKPCRVPYYPGPTGFALGSPSAAGCKTRRDSRTGCGGYAGVIASLIALTGRASRRTAAASWRSWPGAAPPRSMPRSRPGRHRPSGTGPQPGGRAVHRAAPRTRPRGSRPPRRADQPCPRQACGAQQPRWLRRCWSGRAIWPGAAPRPSAGRRGYGQLPGAYRSCFLVWPVSVGFGTARVTLAYSLWATATRAGCILRTSAIHHGQQSHGHDGSRFTIRPG